MPSQIKNNIFAFYHGMFSNFHNSPFVVKNGNEILNFSCNEQYFMWSKAILFNDKKIAEQILNEFKPKVIKGLGRKVKNFDGEIWNIHKKNIMLKGLVYKFTQNSDVRKALLDTNDLIIVEASPYDKVWGCGSSVSDDDTYDKSKWKGQNLLGTCLMEVRECLKTINDFNNEVEYTENYLKTLTKEKLIMICKQKKIVGYSKYKKDELIEFILSKI